MTLADKILAFQKKLTLNVTLPDGVHVMNPYLGKPASSVCEKFYREFYADGATRTMILGINPGRLGGGITGIPFTDPLKLEQLGIPNDLQKKRELSADFIYQMIDAFGGAPSFYKKFYISSVCPLGFTKDEKNLNYYDVKGLPELLKEFMISAMKQQLDWGLNRDVSFCMGEGENFKFLKKLNSEQGFFKSIEPLPHPRFIMQYRRKTLDTFIQLYVEHLGQRG